MDRGKYKYGGSKIMIDNPLPDQVMQEMDRVHAAWEFEELCKDHAFKLAQDNFVYEELIGDFQEWFFLYCIDHSEDEYARSLPDDKDLIDEWWDEMEDNYEYNDPYDIEPSDDQMMSMFGTKWHDGL